ncbi:carbohydrate-binding module family 48 protein [Mucor lusitanicus CBS 277.49]|uniref:Carbohydrate-binding module family 48 protein n=2 Tax=Mucor circinelloides f. lusitanicus TaxID=29924 RepID=A0A168IP51_MUCCL|nr:carbohydrate-binding module family 48 protein [Mucor lusitanicus CBS 277.49]
MRDWLALPLNTTAAGSSSSSSASTSSAKRQLSSDEGITTDEDEYRYDIIHESASTEEELEVTECQHEGQNEELSTWMSILNVFGVASKLKKRSSSSSSSSLSSSTSSLDAKKSREIIPKPEMDVAIEDEEEEHLRESDTGFDEQDQEQEQEPTQLQRTLSSSSIASSTDTDNSTPASSQIMRSSSTPSKYYHSMTMSKTTNVEIRWNHGGKKVQVTGEFDNWSVSVDMVQDTENSNCHVVEIPMDLSKDIEFKFIVDGEWRYANDLPHRTDWRGNINNVVYKKENPTTLVNE